VNLGWITAEVDNGKIVTEISVTTLNEDGTNHEFVLNERFWTSSLLSPKYKSDFEGFWDKHLAQIVARKHVLDESKKMRGFSELCKLFVHDLRKFSDNESAQERLSASENAYFLGLPYFAPETVEKILGLPFGNKTLRDKLDALKQKKESENSGELCASHDLAPIFEAVLEVKWAQVKSELKGSKKFLRNLEKHLLKLPKSVLQPKTNV
jgi:hypothetical protein